MTDQPNLEINLAMILAAAIESSETKSLTIRAEHLNFDYDTKQLALTYDEEQDALIAELVDINES